MVEKSAVKVLVLDDEPFMLKLLGRMLAAQGYTQVTTCDNGQVALDYLDSPNGAPDLILSDLNMPHMDGVEFVPKLVERGYTGSLILVSGEDDRVLQSVEKLGQAHRIAELGRPGKPPTPEGLAALLAKWSPPSQARPRAANKSYGADEVHAAIANGELVNYYQPKVAVATGEVVGVEALVRWRHPVDGMVFPDQFVGVAETHGLIDELKVDRSFVHGAAADATVRAIYEASLALAKQLNMDVVAEGVEDQADWDFLRRTGCHLAQGYFIAKPMPAADLPGWIKVWQERVRSGFPAQG